VWDAEVGFALRAAVFIVEFGEEDHLRSEVIDEIVHCIIRVAHGVTTFLVSSCSF